jgi:uncharacterized protein (TIGR02594 family)
MFFRKKEKELPWMVAGKAVWGMHEVKDNAVLKQWLRSDGKTLGDPKALPWCGDYVETCIRNSLPREIFSSKLDANPYWARNWLHFGLRVTPCYGAVLVFKRGNGGHVGFGVGEDATDYYVLGGNQSNAVNITRISKDRLLGATWPKTFDKPVKRLTKMKAGSIPRTTNEF